MLDVLLCRKLKLAEIHHQSVVLQAACSKYPVPLFQAAFSDTVTSASAPPNSSKFKNDAGICCRFYCESRANRESCHHPVFPFQRQMNALLARDQAILAMACLGSLLGPMFARLVLLLALSPLGKLEATLLETSDNRVSSIIRRHPTFPTSSNVTVPASETLSRTCSVSSNNMTGASQKADCICLQYMLQLQEKQPLCRLVSCFSP